MNYNISHEIIHFLNCKLERMHMPYMHQSITTCYQLLMNSIVNSLYYNISNEKLIEFEIKVSTVKHRTEIFLKQNRNMA